VPDRASQGRSYGQLRHAMLGTVWDCTLGRGSLAGSSLSPGGEGIACGLWKVRWESREGGRAFLQASVSLFVNRWRRSGRFHLAHLLHSFVCGLLGLELKEEEVTGQLDSGIRL
jgi:hypothetical protein